MMQMDDNQNAMYDPDQESDSFLEETQAMEEQSRRMQQDIAERAEKIRAIKKDFVTVNNMFIDFAEAVDEQDQMLGHIETTANSARSNLKAGQGELVSANKSQSGLRSKYCIAAVVVTILVAICIIVVVAVVMTRPKTT